MQFLDKFFENFFKSEGDRKKLVNVVVPSFAIQATAIIIGLVTNFVMARGLGASKYGVFTFAFSIVFPLVNLVSFGVGVLMVREIPHILTKNTPGLLRGLHNWSIKLAIPSCIVLALVLSGTVYFLPSGTYKTPILIASAVIPFYALMNFYSASLKGFHKIVLSQIADNLIRPTVFLALIILLFYFSNHFSANAIILANVIAFAFGMAYSAIMFYKTVDLKYVEPEYDTRRWWKGFASLSLLNGILSLDARLDLLILGFIKNSTQVGVFTISHKIALTLYFFMSVMNTIIGPSISRMNSLNDKAGLQKMIHRTIRWVMAFSLPTGIIIIIFSKWILSYFGPEFVVGQTALIIMCVAQLFSISCGPAGIISIMTGNEKLNTIATALSMTTTIILNMILTPYFGLTGSAIAVAGSIVIWNIYLVIKVKKHVGIYSWIYTIR